MGQRHHRFSASLSTARPKIAYIDLFAGPGRYKDGAASTPLMILEKAVADPKIAQRLVSIFNDEDTNNTATLQNHGDTALT